MKHWVKMSVAVLLVISLVTGMLPLTPLRDDLSVLLTKASAEKARSEQAMQAAAEAESRFRTIAEEAKLLLETESPEDDGEWQYVLLPESRYAVIVGHHDQGASRIVLPSELGGGDVVALLSDVFEGHSSLLDVTFSTNVYYAAPDALPRGVGVRGYHGTYAQHWAAANRRSFENLSELDFVTGVIDCSDVNPAYFSRISSGEVLLRALEASRLQEGSIFFLIDPDHVYTVSYYRVRSMTEEGRMMRIRCETPEIADLLNSYHVENATMMLDPSTFQPAAGVGLEEEGSRAFNLGGSAEGEWGFSFTPHYKKGHTEISGKIQYETHKTKISIDYSNLKVHSYTKKTSTTTKLSAKFQIKGSPTEKDPSGLDDSIDLGTLTQSGKINFFRTFEKESRQALGKAVVFTAGGIVSLEVEIDFAVKFSLTGEVSYCISEENTERYSEGTGKLVSESRKKDQSFNTTIKGEVKAGLDISFKLLLGTVLEVAKVSLFVGVKLEAKFEYEESVWDTYQAHVRKLWALSAQSGQTGSEAWWNALASLKELIDAGDCSIADLNMMDCLTLTVHFLIEGSARVGNDWFTIWSGKLTLLDLEIAKYHTHLWYNKFICDIDDPENGLKAVSKTSSEVFHKASECPLMDQVYLMIPAFDTNDNKDAAFGTIDLRGRTALLEEDIPQLDLYPFGFRLVGWYKDRDLTLPVQYPLPVANNDRLYGKVVEVKKVNLVNYAGNALVNAAGEEVRVFLAEGEQVQTDSLDLDSADHLVGWYEVDGAENLRITGALVNSRNLTMVGDGQEHTWMAVFDNDLMLYFYGEDGQALGSPVTWGHNLAFPAENVPSPAETWTDGDSGHWGDYQYTWARRRTRDPRFTLEKVVTFPCTFREIASVIELDVQSTEMVHRDNLDYGVTSPGFGSGEELDLSSMKVYDDEGDFTYSVNSDRVTVTVTGFKTQRTVTQDDGTTATVTVQPKAFSVPETIDGKRVTKIGGSAFTGEKLSELVYAKLPSGITSLGQSVFKGSPIVMLDLSLCTGLTAIPASFAQNALLLRISRLPDSIASIGNYAFQNCASIVSVELNATLGLKAFAGCIALETAKLGRGATSIGESSFEGCSSLKELTVPCSATSVGNYFIRGCTALESLTFDGAPKTITSSIMIIGADSHLSTLVFRKGVTTFNSAALGNGSYGNPYLTDITFPNAPITAYANVLKGTAVERLQIYELNVAGGSMAKGCTTLQEVTVERGEILTSTFQGCTALKKVTMGSGVLSVGESAFQSCSSLENVTMGENVEYIGKNAFRDCTGLVTAALGDRLESIGSYAFYGCKALTTVNSGTHLREIGEGAFYGCSSLEKLELPPTVESYGNNMIYGCIAMTNLTLGGRACPELSGIAFAHIGPNAQLQEIEVREGVTAIMDGFFSNYFKTDGVLINHGYPKLKSVSLPASLNVIGEEAFRSSASLTDINIPSGVTSIGASAFYDCKALQPTFSAGLQLQTIGASAFYRCAAMEEIPLGNRLTSVGNQAFYGCASLRELDFPAAVESYGTNMISGCKGLTKVTLGGRACPVLSGDSFMNIGANAQLEEIVVREGVTDITDSFFRNGKTGGGGYPALTSVSLPETLETIGALAFYGNAALTSINIPSGVTSVGNSAFRMCSSLTELPFPSCKEIGSQAFMDCTSLTKIIFSDNLTAIGDNAFANCTNLFSLELGHGLVTLGSSAFSRCVSLETVELPATVERYGDKPFNGCTGLKHVTLGGPACPELRSGLLNLQARTTALTSVTIREGVTTLPDHFLENSYANYLSSVYGFGSLTEVSLPESLEAIGDWAFLKCSALRELIIPSGVTCIGSSAFYGCTRLRPVLEEDSLLETVGTEAFINCSEMETLILNCPLREIGAGAFRNCTGLRYLDLPETVESYGNSLLAGCSALQVLALGGESCPLIAGGIFDIGSQTALKKLILREGIAEIGESAFANGTYGFGSLTDLSLPSTLWTIGDYAFRNAAGLRTVFIPETTRMISETAFDGCPDINLVYNDSHLLRVYHGTNLLYSGQLAMGTDLTALLEDLVPEDDSDETIFLGWRMDAEGVGTVHLTEMPGCDLTLYACMTPRRYLRLYTLVDGLSIAYRKLFIGAGLTIPWPDEPWMEGYHFSGWYYDKNLTRPFSEGTLMPDTDLTLYGDMRSTAVGAVYRFTEDHAELVQYVPAELENTEVWLPAYADGLPVTVIAADAFRSADTITRLHLPDRLESLDPQVLEDLPNLTWLSIGSGNANYSTLRGILYTADLSELIRCPIASPITNYTAPQALRKIDANAFASCRWLKRVDLGSDVTEIGANAFDFCQNLVSFTAYGLETIGADALTNLSGELMVYGPIGNCPLRNHLLDNSGSVLKAPYNQYGLMLHVSGALVNALGMEAGTELPASLIYTLYGENGIIRTWFTDSELTAAWDQNALMPARNLSLYTVPEQIYSWEAVTLETEDGPVSGILLTSYNGPGGDLVLPVSMDGQPVIAIGDRFLADCYGTVSSVQIGSDVIQIGNSALEAPPAYPFGGVVKADEGSYAAEWAILHGYICVAGMYRLSFETNGGAPLNRLTLPLGTEKRLPTPVKTGCVFLGWYMNEALTVPVELTEGCFVMPKHDVTLYAAWEGNGVDWPFAWEISGTGDSIILQEYTGDGGDVVLPEEINGLPVCSVASCAFMGSSVTSVTIPDCVETLGSRVFSGCESLTTVRIGAGLNALGTQCFTGCPALTEIAVDESNSIFQSKNGVLLAGNMTLLCYPAGKADTEYTVPGGITVIGTYAFSGAGSLRAVNLPDELAAMGEGAFENCAGLTSVTLTEEMDLSTIPAGCFSGCSALTQVSLNPSVTSIQEMAFFGCNALTRLDVPANRTVVEEDTPVFSASAPLTVYCLYANPIRLYAISHSISVVCTDRTEVESLTVACDQADLDVGEYTILHCDVAPAEAAAWTEITWTSSDPEVFSLYDGKAYATKAGTSIITAEAANGVRGSVTLKATVPLRSLEILDVPEELTTGSSTLLRLKKTPANASETITWSVGDPTIVSITEEGLLQGLIAGETTVTATAERGISVTCTVVVADAVIEHHYIPHAATAPNCSHEGNLFYYSCEDCDQCFDENYQPLETGAWILPTRPIHDCSSGACAYCGRSFVFNGLKTLRLPAALTTVEAESFYGVDAQLIVLPEGCVSLETDAFGNCASLKYVSVPKSLMDTLSVEDLFQAIDNSNVEVVLH